MRSRCSAYALHLADYIMQTTHPSNPAYQADQRAWREEILQFCRDMQFTGLHIEEVVEEKDLAMVTFTAYLKQGDVDATFREKSLFIKKNGRWFYASGEILGG